MMTHIFRYLDPPTIPLQREKSKSKSKRKTLKLGRGSPFFLIEPEHTGAKQG
jgi:hypothetical protein